MTSETSVFIEVYQDPENDGWSVTVIGSDEWDALADLTEQEARDEAEAISYEIGAPVVFA